MQIVFTYDVDPDRRPDFERAYGPDGAWAAFFGTDPAYLGTALHRADDDPARYLVVDHWTSAGAYAAFLDRHRDEYDRRSRDAAPLYVRETRLGRFGTSVAAPGVELQVLAGTYAACRLDARAEVPAWASGGELHSITRTTDELSVVCRADAVPEDVQAERGWRCLRVAGPLEFTMTGVAAALASPLAGAGIPILLIATYDTDYLLVRDHDFDRAVTALAAAGHGIRTGS